MWVGCDLTAHPRRWMLAIVAIGFAGRAAFGLFYWVDKPLTHDEREYLALAGSLAAGQGFRYPAEPAPSESEPQRFGRAPLYPALLAILGVGTLTGDVSDASLRRMKLAQAAIGALGVWLIGRLAWGTGGVRAGLIAAGIAACYPPLVWIPAYVLSETLFSALALASALLLAAVTDRSVRAPRFPVRVLLLAGGMAGLAALTRPVGLFFLAGAAGWLAVRGSGRRPGPGRDALRLAGAFSLGAFLVLAPWTARNLAEHGRLVLVASEGGITFWTGNHPLAIGEGDMAANPRIKLANQALRRRHSSATPEQLEAIYYREALTYIMTRPSEWLALLGRKLFYLVVPIGPSYTLHSTRYYLASVLSYGLVLPFALAGLWQWRRSSARPRALLVLGASTVLASLIFFPQERFRIPVLDPVLIVCAASWLAGRQTPGRAHASGATAPRPAASRNP